MPTTVRLGPRLNEGSFTARPQAALGMCGGGFAVLPQSHPFAATRPPVALLKWAATER